MMKRNCNILLSFLLCLIIINTNCLTNGIKLNKKVDTNIHVRDSNKQQTLSPSVISGSSGKTSSSRSLNIPKVEQEVDDPTDTRPRDYRPQNPNDGSMMVDNTDPCATYEGCGACNQDSRCGWCAANSKCMVGGPEGPKMQKCAAWTKEFCEAESCSSYTHCMGCLADPYCGWCPSDDQDGGKCMEGSGGGPTDGTCDSNWAHSPVRKGTNYKQTSILDATHKAYLRETCESPEKRMVYAKPPPDNSKPASAKDPTILRMEPMDGPTFGSTVITITGLWFGFTDTNQTVYIGEHPCAETNWKSESVIECVTAPSPKVEGGTFHVYIESDGRFSGGASDAKMTTFTYKQMTIDTISKLEGPTEGGTIINIVGKMFGRQDHSPLVMVGDEPCIGTQWVSSSKIQCASPPGVGDNNEISVEILGYKQSNKKKFIFVYDIPVIISISATDSPTTGNRSFVIIGENFGTAKSMPVITVGGVPCLTQERVSHSEMKCATPPNVGRNKRVVVASGHRFSKEVGFMVHYDPPIVANISPIHGRTIGGYTIVIKGANFGTGAYNPRMTFRPDAWLLDVLSRASATYTDRKVNPSWGAWANTTGAAGVPTAHHNTSIYKLLPRLDDFSNNTNNTNGTDGFNSSDILASTKDRSILKNERVQNDIKDIVRLAAQGSASQALETIAKSVLKSSSVGNDKGQSGGKKDVAAMISAAAASVNTVKNAQKNGQDVDSTSVENALKTNLGSGHTVGGGYGNTRRRRLLSMDLNQFATTDGHKMAFAHIEKTATNSELAQLAKALVLLQTSEGGGYGSGGYGQQENAANLDAGQAMTEDTKNASETVKALNSQNGKVAKKTKKMPMQQQEGTEEEKPVVVREPVEEFTKKCPNGQGNDYTAAGLECIEVLVAGYPCRSVQMLADDTLECIAPDYIGANHSVTVIVGNQSTSAMSNNERVQRLVSDVPNELLKQPEIKFSYDPPIVTHLFPDVGPTAGMITMTLKGFNFGTRDWRSDFGNATLAITVGGEPCVKSIWISDGVVECLVPPGSGTRHKVFVSVADQTYPADGQEPLLFSYSGPELLEVFPSHGSTEGAYDVILTGRNFGTKYHLPNVFIDGRPCTSVKWVSDTIVKCLVPEGLGKAKSVVVWAGDQHSKLDNDMWDYDIPEVTSVSPDHCRTFGECKLTIKGRNFGFEQGEHIKVTVGGQLCTTLSRGDQPLWINPRTLECFVRPGVGGKLDVRVTVGGQVSKPNDLFSYDIPVITSILPKHGNCEGGLVANITGINFGTSDWNPTASINGFKCKKTKWISDTKIQCTTPTSYGPRVKTTVFVSNQQSNDNVLARDGHFDYDPPEVYDMSIHKGSVVGSNNLVLSGINFPPDAKVVFKGMKPMGGEDIKECKKTTWKSYNELTCETPCGIDVKHTVHIVSNGYRFVQSMAPGRKIIQKCPEPEFLRNGYVDGTNRYEGARLIYSCYLNHTMIGNSMRECKNGKWTGFLPVCMPPPKRVPTKLYYDKERSGHDASKYDVAPASGEPEELDVAQKIAKVGLEKMQVEMKLKKIRAKNDVAIEDAEREKEVANKRISKIRDMMDHSEKEQLAVEKRLQNYTNEMHKKMEEAMKKNLVGSQKNKQSKGMAKAHEERLQYAAKTMKTSEPANTGEPELPKEVADKEVNRLNILKMKEDQTRQLADSKLKTTNLEQDYEMESKKLTTAKATLKTLEEAALEANKNGNAATQREAQDKVDEAKNKVEMANFAKLSTEKKLQRTKEVAEKLEKRLAQKPGEKEPTKVSEKESRVQTDKTLGVVIRGEYVPIVINDNGAAAPKMYDVFVVSKHGGLMKYDVADKACSLYGGQLAYPSLLNAARMAGMARCSPGWVSNGESYTVTRAIVPGCVAQRIGVSSIRVQEADAFCFKNMKMGDEMLHQYSKDVSKETTKTLSLVEVGSDASVTMVPALRMFDMETGKHVRDYFDPTSLEGQKFDRNVYYILSGKMKQKEDLRFSYDIPEVHRLGESEVLAKGSDAINIFGKNFGCMDARHGPKILAEVKVVDGVDGKGWVKCRRTTWKADNHVVCETPAGAGKTNEVRVTIGGQTSEATTKGSYHYRIPVITKIVPDSGDPKGNYTIDIYGRNFGTVQSTFKDGYVTIRGETCLETTWVSDRQIKCKVPPGSGPGVDVKIWDVEGRDSINHFKKFGYALPTVDKVVPDHLPTTGGTIKISGNYYGICLPTSKRCLQPKAYINGVACTRDKRLTPELIECDVPEGVGEKLNVRVVYDRQTSLHNTLFSYDRPILGRLKTLHGPAVGGYWIDMNGENFGTKDSVETQGEVKWNKPHITLGGIKCSDTKRLSDNLMSCKVNTKPFMGKFQDVEITIADQINDKSTNKTKLWTIDPPVIYRVEPQLINPLPHAHTVTFIGENFGNWCAGKCRKKGGLGNVNCQYIDWVSDTRARCILAARSSISHKNNNDEWRRPWVVVGKQESYNPLTKVTEKFYKMRYLKYADRDMPVGKELTRLDSGANRDSCSQKCEATEGCVGFIMKGSVCSLRGKDSLKSCGKTKTESKGSDVYLHESITSNLDSLSYCHSPVDVRFRPYIAKISKTVGDTNGNEWITFTGGNFGNKDTAISRGPDSKGPVAYVGPQESDKCLETKWISKTKLKCLTPPNDLAPGKVYVDDTFDSSLSPRKSQWDLRSEYTTARVSSDAVGAVYGKAMQFDGTGAPRMATTKYFDVRYGGKISFMMKWDSSNFDTRRYVVAIQYQSHGGSWYMVERWEARKYASTFQSSWKKVIVKIPGSSKIRFRWRMAMIDENAKRDENTGRYLTYSWPSSCGSSTQNRFAIDNVVIDTTPGGGPVKAKFDNKKDLFTTAHPSPTFRYDSDGLQDISYRTIDSTTASEAMLVSNSEGWQTQAKDGAGFTLKLETAAVLQVIRYQHLSEATGCKIPESIEVVLTSDGSLESRFTVKFDKDRRAPKIWKAPVPNPLFEEMQVTIKSYHKGSGTCTGFQLFQARGEILRYINRPGEGYTTSRSNGNYPGTHPSYAIAYPLTKDAKGWKAYRAKHAWIQMDMRSKFKVVEMRWTQQDVHMAMEVDVNGQRIVLTNTLETKAYKFKTPITTSRITVRVLSTYDKKGIPVNNVWNWGDSFGNERNTQQSYFIMASKNNNGLTYGFEHKNMSTFYKHGDRIIWRFRHSMWFTGSHQDISATRTRNQYPVLGGTKISATWFQTGVNGDYSKNKCPNYFIMVSPEKDVKFTFGSTKNVVKFVFNCATKYIYMPESKDNVAKEMKVANNNHINWGVYVNEKGVTFNDNVGGGSIKAENKLFSTWKSIYVFYGASQDIPKYKSHLLSTSIISQGTGAKSIEFIGSELGLKAIKGLNSLTAKLSGTKSTSPTRLNGLELGNAVNNGDLKNSVAYSNEAPGIYSVAGSKLAVKKLKWKRPGKKSKSRGFFFLELGADTSSDFENFKKNVAGACSGQTGETLFKNVDIGKDNQIQFSCLDNKALCDCISKTGQSSSSVTFSDSKYTLKLKGDGETASYEVVNKKRRRRLFQRGSGGIC
jgi:hypothetical protein